MRDEHSGATQQDSRPRAGQRRRALGRRSLAVGAADADPRRRPAGQGQSHRRGTPVSARSLLHLPKQRSARVFRHAVRTRLHPDRHDRSGLYRRPRRGAARRRRKSSISATPRAAISATPVTTDQVIWSYSGVRPLYDDGASEAQEATRDYVLKLDATDGAPALLSIFGGKITTYRRLAESALAMLARYLPPAPQAAGWTARGRLPGGDFPVDGFEDAGGRHGRAISFSRAGRRFAGSSAPTARASEAVLGRGENAIGSRSDFRRRADRGRGPLSRPRTNGR